MLKFSSYPIPDEDSFKIEMPQDAKIISVKNEDGEVRLCAIVDPQSPKEIRKFQITKFDRFLEVKKKNLEYIGNFQSTNGTNSIFEIKQSL
ncbi:MAG: hypothetical protein ABH919_02955 [bacterium]